MFSSILVRQHDRDGGRRVVEILWAAFGGEGYQRRGLVFGISNVELECQRILALHGIADAVTEHHQYVPQAARFVLATHAWRHPDEFPPNRFREEDGEFETGFSGHSRHIDLHAVGKGLLPTVAKENGAERIRLRQGFGRDGRVAISYWVDVFEVHIHNELRRHKTARGVPTQFAEQARNPMPPFGLNHSAPVDGAAAMRSVIHSKARVAAKLTVSKSCLPKLSEEFHSSPSL